MMIYFYFFSLNFFEHFFCRNGQSTTKHDAFVQSLKYTLRIRHDNTVTKFVWAFPSRKTSSSRALVFTNCPFDTARNVFEKSALSP